MSETEFDESEITEEEQSEQEAAQPSGPGAGDIFSRSDTKSEITVGTAVFALVGVGLGLGALLAEILEEGSIFNFIGAYNSGLLFAPLLGVYIAQRQNEALSDLADNVALATAAVTGFVGTIVFGLVVWLFGEISFDTFPEIGDMLLPVIGLGIGVAVAAAGAVWATRNLADGGA